MNPEPDCPACGARNWQVVGERTYRAADIARLKGWSQKALRVLFEVWSPGAESFQVKFAGCRACGMMVYLPRPTPADLDEKYRFAATLGDNNPNASELSNRTQVRAKRIWNMLFPHVGGPIKGRKVLDFGGGDGRLMREFIDAGADCEVIDYCETPIDRVRHLGLNEESLPADARYAAIICSHVVEHLSEPVVILRRLAACLDTDGAIYVEVPVEMVGKLPAAVEPVTHCNFFIPESLGSLLESAGLKVVTNELSSYPHPTGNWTLCATAVAKRGGDQAVAARDGIATLDSYLHPSLPFKLRVAALLWRRVPRRILRALKPAA